MRKLACLATILMTAMPAPAEAAVELWNQFGTEVILTETGGLRPESLSFTTDVRYNDQLAGMERVQLRWGPRWELSEAWTLGVNHTAYFQQPDPGVFVQEQRAELEPSVSGEWGPLAWRDRSRLEYRWRPDRQRWRYRNQLRVEGEVAKGWTPFASDEVFFDLAGPGFNENRLTLGLAREVAGSGWELGYTYRTMVGAAATGGPDHLITVAWFNALRRAPLIADADL